MYVWPSLVHSRVWINRVRLPILLHISLCPFAPQNLVSRDRFDRPVPRQPAHAESGRLNLAATHNTRGGSGYTSWAVTRAGRFVKSVTVFFLSY